MDKIYHHAFLAIPFTGSLWSATTCYLCRVNWTPRTLKSTSVSVCFRGISRLPSVFVFLRWFKLAHISIQVCTFHDGCKQGIDQQIFNRKSILRKITHPQLPNNTVKNVSVTLWFCLERSCKKCLNSVIPPAPVPCKTFCFVCSLSTRVMQTVCAYC